VQDKGKYRLRELNRIESGIGWNQAVWNRSIAYAGVRRGALMDKPRRARMLAITVGCSMAAMIFKVLPQWQFSRELACLRGAFFSLFGWILRE
jgi:hypothetical protein